MSIENKEAWNLFGNPFGKKPEATPPTPAGTPLQEPSEGKGIQKKFFDKAKQTPNDDHGMVTQTILVNPGFSDSYRKLEKAAPKAYKLVTKYIDKWHVEADKLQPSGGLTSKDAAFWDNREPNAKLLEILEDFSKKNDLTLLGSKEIENNYTTLVNRLKKFEGVTKTPLTQEEKAIRNFYQNLEKAFPDTADIKPPKLKQEIRTLKQELEKMVKDQSALTPKVKKDVEQKIPVTPTSVPSGAPSPAAVPKVATDNKVNGTSISYGDIQIVGPLMEVDASSSDEIDILSEILFKK